MELTFEHTGVLKISNKPRPPRSALLYFLDSTRTEQERMKLNKAILIRSSSSADSSDTSSKFRVNPKLKKSGTNLIRRCRAKWMKMTDAEKKPYIKQEEQDRLRCKWETAVFSAWDANLTNALTCSSADAPTFPRTALQFFAEDVNWDNRRRKCPTTDNKKLSKMFDKLDSRSKLRYKQMEKDDELRSEEEIKNYPKNKNREALEKWVTLSTKYRNNLTWVITHDYILEDGDNIFCAEKSNVQDMEVDLKDGPSESDLTTEVKIRKIAHCADLTLCGR